MKCLAFVLHSIFAKITTNKNAKLFASFILINTLLIMATGRNTHWSQAQNKMTNTMLKKKSKLIVVDYLSGKQK